MTDRTNGPMDGVKPFAFAAPLAVCVDVKHPMVYLALDPVQALSAQLGVAVDWLPFPSAPLKPPPPPADDRGTRHRRARALYLETDIQRYAEARGLTIRGLYRSPDSSTASLALLWLRDRAPQKSLGYLQRVCSGYWAEDLDIEDVTAVGAMLETLGEDPQAFITYVGGRGRGELAELRGRLVAAGVFTVPSLVVEDEVFVGRAHLPMVRWVLTGRSGPPPI